MLMVALTAAMINLYLIKFGWLLVGISKVYANQLYTIGVD